MTALNPILQFRVVRCPDCGESSLPWAMGLDEENGGIIWGCGRCDAVLAASALQSGMAVAPATLNEFGYILDGEGETGGCGSDGGACSSCGSRTKHD